MSKIYTVYSETHEELFNNFFMESFNRVIGNNDLLHVKRSEQYGNGSWLNKGWNRSMLEKVDLVIMAINENIDKDGWFIHSDVDVIWVKDCIDLLHKELGDYDIAAQSDLGTLCFGFFAMRANKNTLKWLENIRANVINSEDGRISTDQHTANETKDMVKWKLLPNTFYNRSMGPIPENLQVVHANYIIGVKNKIEFLKNIQ